MKNVHKITKKMSRHIFMSLLNKMEDTIDIVLFVDENQK